MLYNDMQQLAKDILGDPDFKQGVIKLVTMTPAASNPQPWKPNTATPTKTTLNAVVRGVSFKYVQQGLAIASDLQVTMSVPAIRPTMEDYIEIDGKPLKIVQIINKPAAGTTVAITCIVRKG